MADKPLCPSGLLSIRKLISQESGFDIFPKEAKTLSENAFTASLSRLVFLKFSFNSFLLVASLTKASPIALAPGTPRLFSERSMSFQIRTVRGNGW